MTLCTQHHSSMQLRHIWASLQDLSLQISESDWCLASCLQLTHSNQDKPQDVTHATLTPLTCTFLLSAGICPHTLRLICIVSQSGFVLLPIKFNNSMKAPHLATQPTPSARCLTSQTSDAPTREQFGAFSSLSVRR